MGKVVPSMFIDVVLAEIWHTTHWEGRENATSKDIALVRLWEDAKSQGGSISKVMNRGKRK